jgi:hypothetical protein
MTNNFIAPQPILQIDDKDKINLDPYDGDMQNLTERRKYKLFNIWSTWNDCMMNLKKIEEMTEDEVKFTLYSLIDRIGRILSSGGDIGIELIAKD